MFGDMTLASLSRYVVIPTMNLRKAQPVVYHNLPGSPFMGIQIKDVIIEVPQVQEVIRHVPKIEIQEEIIENVVEKKVPLASQSQSQVKVKSATSKLC